VSLPRSLTCLLDRFRGRFTTPTVSTFCGLACGFWAQPGLHTLTGMLIGARLERTWHHARAHRFFSHARWSADQLGVCLLDLIVVLLVPDGVPVRLVCDETLASIPATAQPSAISPELQRLTRPAWSRTISIIDSIGLVDATGPWTR
jgi:DDE superfamily endonuclease